MLYPPKLSFRMEGQLKCFPDEVKLKEFIIIKPVLYKMLKGLSMNSKMTTNSQLSTTEPKKRTKTKLANN